MSTFVTMKFAPRTGPTKPQPPSSWSMALLRLFRRLSRILKQAMRVRVLLFGVLKDIFQRSEDSLELGSRATVSDLLDHYRALVPDRASLFHSLALAVNQEYAAPARRLQEGDEVALLPPVSGGVDVGVRQDNYRCDIVRERIPTE